MTPPLFFLRLRNKRKRTKSTSVFFFWRVFLFFSFKIKKKYYVFFPHPFLLPSSSSVFLSSPPPRSLQPSLSRSQTGKRVAGCEESAGAGKRKGRVGRERERVWGGRKKTRHTVQKAKKMFGQAGPRCWKRVFFFFFFFLLF